MFCEELLAAKQAKDDNVLAIEGVQIIEVHTLSIVSEWMDNGNLLTYLEGNADANRAELVSPPPRSRHPFSNSFECSCLAWQGPQLLALHRNNPWGS